MEFAEDTFMGDVLRRCPNVTALALVREFSANVDEGGNPQNAYFERARPCYSSVGRTPTWATLEHPRRAGGRCACCPRGRPPRHRDSGRGAADHGREDGLGLARGRHAAAGAPSPLISPDLPWPQDPAAPRRGRRPAAVASLAAYPPRTSPPRPPAPWTPGLQGVIHKVSSAEKWKRVQRLVDAWRPLARVPCLHPPLGLKYRNGEPVEQRPAPRVWPGPPEEESAARTGLPYYFGTDHAFDC